MKMIIVCREVTHVVNPEIADEFWNLKVEMSETMGKVSENVFLPLMCSVMDTK